MAAISKNKNDLLRWVEKVISSCVTLEQLTCATKLAYRFLRLYPMPDPGDIYNLCYRSESEKIIVRLVYDKRKQIRPDPPTHLKGTLYPKIARKNGFVQRSVAFHYNNVIIHVWRKHAGGRRVDLINIFAK